MQSRLQVMAHEGEEASDGKSLVAVAQNLPVDGVTVEDVRDEGYDGVDGDHEEDADNVLLLPRLRVVCGMLHHEDEGDYGRDGGKGGGEEEAKVVESEALP